MNLANKFLSCCILLSCQVALAARGPRLRERWRLQLRLRVGAGATRALAPIASSAPAPCPVNESPASLKSELQPVDKRALTSTADPPLFITASLRSAPPGFVDSPAWDFDSASRLLMLLEASEATRPVHRALVRGLTSRRQYYSQEYNARRPDGDELKDDAMVEVTNAVAAHLPASRISVKRLKNILQLRAEYDRQMLGTSGSTFSWKKHLSQKHRTIKKLATTEYSVYRRSQSKAPAEGDKRSLDEVLGGSLNQGEELDETLGDGQDQGDVLNETLSVRQNQNEVIDEALGDNLNQSEALIGRQSQGKGLDEALGGKRNQSGALGEILGDRQNQIEVPNVALSDLLNQSQALNGRRNKGEGLDEELNDRPNQDTTLDEGSADRQNQGSVLDKTPGDKRNQGEVQDEELGGKLGEADNKSNQGDALDKVLYEALIDRQNQGDVLGKALNEALGNRQNPGEALDKAVNDRQNPSEAIDKALHEALGIRGNQGDILDKTLREVLGPGRERGEDERGNQVKALGDTYSKEDLPAGNDNRRAYDNADDDMDATQLYNELSINDTNDDDFIHKAVAAAIAADSNEREESSTLSPAFVSAIDVVNAISTSNIVASSSTSSDSATSGSSTIIQNVTAKELTNIKTIPVLELAEGPRIAYYNNSFNSDYSVYLDGGS